MLGDIRARRGRRAVEHLAAAHTEDLRVRQGVAASSAYRRGVGDRVIGVSDQMQCGAGRTGLLTLRLTRTRPYGALGGGLLGERRVRRRWFAAVGGIPTELGVQRRDQAFQLRHPRQQSRVLVAHGRDLTSQGRVLRVLGRQQRRDVAVCCLPAGLHDRNGSGSQLAAAAYPSLGLNSYSRRSKPSSRTALMGEQPNPWDLLQPQDAMSRHRGAKPCRRCELLGKISLLSPEYLLSVERWPFHSGPPDH